VYEVQALTKILIKATHLRISFEWGHEAAVFAKIMKEDYRLIVDQQGDTVTVVNPFTMTKE
jgi:hypothetical protein